MNNCPYDDTDDVVVVDGKLPSSGKRKRGPNDSKKKSNKKSKANFGVSV
eukprot:CAMPEP_0181025624 /NCGR_PEP_ID=MMETSP1070-20121207/3200_1 /TAXON_ID=265543 /ORGANISM="Minutocellus polymorphus, Strain NH13" /LENGTH=48 /DNA_ID= /DNA_START= /DNA_END= /DNA_ORIENTATION=